MVKYEKARLEEDNSQDIYYILDKMNKFDQSLTHSIWIVILYQWNNKITILIDETTPVEYKITIETEENTCEIIKLHSWETNNTSEI
jgi:hypothetical protein